MMAMTDNVKAVLTVLLLVLTTAMAEAQQTALSDSVKKGDHHLQVDLKFLTQGEVRNGGLASENIDESNVIDHSSFLMGQTRLVIGYQRPSLEARVTLQHQGVWGERGGGDFNVYEAWAKMSKYGLFAQIGRQALAYDDERIIGPNDWAMAALSHDVLRIGYEGYGHKAHLILAYNQDDATPDRGGTYYSGGKPYKTMQTLWYHYDVPKFPLGASLIFMNIGTQAGDIDGKGDTAPRTEWQQLLGGYLKFSPEYWTVEGSYYRQMGKDDRGARLAGWMTSIKTTWQPSERLSLDGGFDYLSGDEYFAVPDPGNTGLTHHDKLGGFTSLFGSHHQFYGAMDFFYVSAYVNGFSPGLQNLYAGGQVQILKSLSFAAHYHYMAMATNLKDFNQTLGHEIELSASFTPFKDVELSAGFSYMTGTKTMERLKRASGDGSLRWGWVTLNITPRLFEL